MADKKQVKHFTKKELEKYDGTEGKPAYIAFKGKIYDVSASYLWANGKHQNRHNAGDDLTGNIFNAPHNEDVLTRYPLIGELAEREELKTRINQRLRSFHIHPITAHFPIVLALLAPLFAFLYLITSNINFEISSFYMFYLGFFSTPAVILSGLFSWKLTYGGIRSSIFVRKIVFSAILMTIFTICLALRLLYPDILTMKDSISYIYLSLLTSLAPIVTILGYYGGKIIYT